LLVLIKKSSATRKFVISACLASQESHQYRLTSLNQPVIMTAIVNDLTGLRVIISYPRGDHSHTWSEKVQRHLEEQGMAAWQNERSVDKGDGNWSRRLVQGMAKADVVICIVGCDTLLCDMFAQSLM